MKKLTFLIGLGWLSASTVFGGQPPRGTLLELHSCELYAGGCVVSSQATLEGRQMLRVWNFAGGTFAGADLSGLQLAVLQSSSDNLAAPEAKSGEAVVYLPKSATLAQRDALLGWLKSDQPDFKPTKLQTRIVPMNFLKNGTAFAFNAGDAISVKTAALEECEMGGCGEALWYTPRSATGMFTVTVNRASTVNEPLLRLQWNDAGKRSVFVGRFGEPARETFVTLADLCGPVAKAF
jgi:hypothetical protein